MKRSLTFALVLLMMFSAMLCVCASDTVYTENELDNSDVLWALNAAVTHETEDDISFTRISAKAGKYENGTLRIHFCPGDISLADYPYIKLVYRSNAEKGLLDCTNRTKRGEGWLLEHPDMQTDELWHSLIINMNDMTGGTGVGLPGETDVQLVLKPFGTRITLLLADSYFDIHTIACFKTLEEAQGYSEEIEYKEPPKVLVKQVYGANRLENDYILSVSQTGLTMEKGDGYYRVSSSAGTYGNDDLKFEFLFPNISLTEHRYIKYRYRTNTTSTRLDTTIRSSLGESWLNTHPTPVGDGEWHDVLVDTFDFTGGGGVPPVGEVGIKFVLKPFGNGTVTLAKDTYFDIEYIACFPELDEATAYVYDPSDDVNTPEITDKGIKLQAADTDLVQKYMDEFEAKRDAIIRSETDVKITGTKYYVSADGDDKNDGKSPESAWKTVANVNGTSFSEGDAVLFKRGDTFRCTETITVQNGVTYSTYGFGHKPVLKFSIDAAGADKWVETDTANIYRYVDTLPGLDKNVGSIIFDDGACWGIQIQQTKSGEWYNIGKCFNGLEFINVTVGKFGGYSSLDADLEYYHDLDTDTLYLYSKDGNPGDRFESVELAVRGNGFGGTEVENVIIDNLEIYGVGSHGIGWAGTWDCSVQNCVFRFIGGSIQGLYLFNSAYGVRYGNAVESGANVVNFTIKNNYASQIYDCCWTVQSRGDYVFDKIYMYGNVSEYCNTGLEIWNGASGRISNMQLYDNYTRYNGYGFSNQRPNKDGNFFYGGSDIPKSMEGNDVYNNVNLFASNRAMNAIATGKDQYNFHDNVYVMEEGKLLGGIAATPENGYGTMKTVYYNEIEILRATSNGWESGSEFYVADSPYENMYASYTPYVRGKLFSDVSSSFWGKNAIDFVTAKGYFAGVSEFEFVPDGTMTRGMLVTVLARIAGESGKSDATYTDIDTDEWYAPGVAWAEENGIVAAGGKFRPDEMATREEMADMFYRYATNVGHASQSGKTTLSDIDSVSPEYKDGVLFCTSNGIITGYEDGTIRPQSDVTRAQAATMIERFVNYLA